MSAVPSCLSNVEANQQWLELLTQIMIEDLRGIEVWCSALLNNLNNGFTLVFRN